MTPTPRLISAGFVVLRTPLLPLNELIELSSDLTAPAAAPSTLSAALENDRELLRNRLRAIVARPEVREALFVASPSLEAGLADWLRDPGSEKGRKVEGPLFRYFTRMCARPTPFGLFAGYSTGGVGASTRFELDSRSEYRRQARLDNDYLSSFCNDLLADPDVKRVVTFGPNSSLYRLARRIRYAKSALSGRERTYCLIDVEPSEYLEATLLRARDGARLGDLARALADSYGASIEDAYAFVDELAAEEILVPDLAPLVTGAESAVEIVTQLRKDAVTNAAADSLAGAQQLLAALNAEPVGVDPRRYSDISDHLRARRSADHSPIVQVTLLKPGRVILGQDAIEEIENAVRWLQATGATGETPLDRFRESFVARYGQREVPLAEALDEESGLGFDPDGPAAFPTIDGPLLDLQPRIPQEPDPRFPLLLQRLTEALQQGRQEIVLDGVASQRVAAGARRTLPDGLGVRMTLDAPSEPALADGDFRLWLHHVYGPSGANLVGRFCQGDESLTESVRAHLREEERRSPDCVFAEIVHMPEGHIGNVLLRPVLRDWEIVYLGRSGADVTKQLRIEDLTVAVEGQRVVLRSSRLGREVIPRNTTAHRTAKPNLGIYRFLCALQNQGTPALGFHWGPLEAAPFLPRVRLGRVVLHPMRWRLDVASLEQIGHADEAAAYRAVQALRQRLSLPRWVCIMDHDHILPVDLENILAVENLAHLARQSAARSSQLVLTEFYGGFSPVVRGPEGLYANELIVPLSRERPAASSPAGRSVDARASRPQERRRSFPPGAEWLYAKLYGGPAACDIVLREIVAPLVRSSRASGALSRWFFVRYADPEVHLRVRFEGQSEWLVRELLPNLHSAVAPALERGLLWKLQLDTYEREVERYGGHDGIVLAEELFCADSDCAVGILEKLSDGEATDARWRVGLLGMDRLLDDLGFTLQEKAAMADHCRDSFAAELRGATGLEHRIGRRFREERLALEALLDASDAEGCELAWAHELFRVRGTVIRAIGADLRRQIDAGSMNTTLMSLAGSYLHMQCNRLVRAAARTHERVLYDFLSRIYKGRLVRRAAKSREPAILQGSS